MELKPITQYYSFIMLPEVDCKKYAMQCAEEVFQSITEFSYLGHDEESIQAYLSRCYFNMPIREAQAWLESAQLSGVIDD